MTSESVIQSDCFMNFRDFNHIFLLKFDVFVDTAESELFEVEFPMILAILTIR